MKIVLFSPAKDRSSFYLKRPQLTSRESWPRDQVWLKAQDERYSFKITKLITGSHTCLTQWNYKPCHVGPPKTDRSWWRVLTKHGPLEKGMANHFSILAVRTPWTVWKGKKIRYWKMNSPDRLVPNMLLEKSREIAPERMHRLSQSENSAHYGCDLWWK